MRKSLVILLIGIHLAGNTEAGQLIRLPQLISHYFQHHQLDNSIGFFEFIAMHYGGDDGTSADDEYDSKLPCHNINHTTTISNVFSPMIKEAGTAAAVPEVLPDHHSRILARQSAGHTLLILQPPRA
ncbi:MAG: hypothetical protein U0U70_03615 [Chitinophagaceae bacterium]